MGHDKLTKTSAKEFWICPDY